MSDKQPLLSEAEGREFFLEAIRKELDYRFKEATEQMVRDFRERVLAERDQIIAGLILTISKQMDFETRVDRMIITIRTDDRKTT